MRLHRYIGQAGLTSRRKAEEWIAEGRVTVNGEVVTRPGTTVAEGDEVHVDGAPVRLPEFRYYVLNKPAGVVTTMSDPGGRPTVASLFPSGVAGLKPVGRLDRLTSGLLLVTNDGTFAARATHARYGLEKEYEATVEREPSERDLARLVAGIGSEGETLRARSAMLVRPAGAKRRGIVRLVLTEGRNRQVRRMLEAVGCPVVQLERVRIGTIRVRGMRPGECRKLSRAEVEALSRLLGRER
jgi:23S rRNA pseudouridine2605 synthase